MQTHHMNVKPANQVEFQMKTLPEKLSKLGPVKAQLGRFTRSLGSQRCITVNNLRSKGSNFSGNRVSRLVTNAAQAGYSGDGSVPFPKDSDITTPQTSEDVDSDPSTTSTPDNKKLNPLQRFLSTYNTFLQRNPVATKACTSFIGFTIGDRLAQTIIDGPFDPYRTLRLGLYGLLLDGPIGHRWYQLLDAKVMPSDPKSNKAVLTKTALDQLIWAPAMTCVFFAFLKLLEGHPDAILLTIQTKLVPTVLANYLLWPMAHYFNFKFVPSEHRILFNNVVSIAWNAWLSWFCHFGGGGGGGLSLGGGGGGGGGGLFSWFGGSADGLLGTSAAAAAAGHASSFLNLPCHAQASDLSTHLLEAAKQTSAMDKLLMSWGLAGLPSGADAGQDLLTNYIDLKKEVLEQVCALPTVHTTPPKF